MVAPHPDDETLGCGATIARKRAAGTTVVVVVCTDGRASSASELVSPSQLAGLRAAELVRACAALGVEQGDVVRLGHPDGALTDNEDDLVDQLAALCEEVSPDEVLVTSALDRHPDHRAANRAVRRLAASNRIRCRVAEYPISFWAEGPWPVHPEGCPLPAKVWYAGRGVAANWRLAPESVAIDENLHRKLEALSAYTSQMANLTGEANWVRLEKEFVANFLLSHEVFFPLSPVPASEVAGGGDQIKKAASSGSRPSPSKARE